jgi:hypothetical protein
MPDIPSNQSIILAAGDNVTLTFTETEGEYWTVEVASTGEAAAEPSFISIDKWGIN